MPSKSYTNVSTASTLSDDIRAIDLDSQAGTGAGNVYTITLTAGATLREFADLSAINLKGADTLVIDGGSQATILDGQALHRGFFVYQGLVTIKNLTIQNTVAAGGDGGAAKQGSGGGGAGLGGGLFVANDAAHNAFPSVVTLDNVFFQNDLARGGAGGAPSGQGFGGGGGGLGGAGGAATSGMPGGGGGIGGLGGAGGNGLAGIVGGGAGGGQGFGGPGHPGLGGAQGGGGGSGSEAAKVGGGGGGISGSAGHSRDYDGAPRAAGGYGGFGGGGGGGGFGGVGGFGGGGGGGGGSTYAAFGFSGGFGGGGGGGMLNGFHGIVGFAGFGAGNGGLSGGGGLGAGGAVFVQEGASISVTGGNLSGGGAVGGQGGGGANSVGGQGLGAGIFLQGNQTISFGAGAASGQTTEIDDVIADEASAGGAGAGKIVVDGAGTVVLRAANTFTGGVTIKGGILDLAAVGAGNGAGKGPITFAPGANATLYLEPAALATGTFSNKIVSLNTGDTLDLRGLAYVAGSTTATATLKIGGVTLKVTNGSATDTLDLSFPSGTTFATKSDGFRGTSVFLVCFVSGTSIRTARGEVPVESLVVGDLALTASGARRPIRWIGSRYIDCAVMPSPRESWPVRVSAGAFGGDLPERDLLLSPGHPVLVGADEDYNGGHLVPIMCLINGTTIERVPVDTVTYWHVELDAHDILLAEGLPAESYLDWGDRAFFTEGADHALANPDFVVPGLAGRCRPVALDGPVVEAERRRLDAVFAMRLAEACAWPDRADDAVFIDVTVGRTPNELGRIWSPADKVGADLPV